MSNFFSFVTVPNEKHSEKYYFDWYKRRSGRSWWRMDSHEYIIKHYKLLHWNCNEYTYNPFGEKMVWSKLNSGIDDSEEAYKWVSNLDFRQIYRYLFTKKVVNPRDIDTIGKYPDEELINAHLREVKEVAVSDDIEENGFASHIIGSLIDMVDVDIWIYVKDTIKEETGIPFDISCKDSFYAYAASFFNVYYPVDIRPAVKLWNEGWLINKVCGMRYAIRACDFSAVELPGEVIKERV